MSIYRPESFFETSLASTITASQDTIPLTVAPNETSGFMVLEANSTNREIVLYTGVSGTTLTGVVRGLAEYGSSLSAGTGKTHNAGVDVANRDVHYYYAQFYDFLTGVSATGANTMAIGDGGTCSGSNRTWTVPLSSYTPFWGLSASGQMVVSEDGTTSYVISAGGSGIAAGDGISIVAGTASVNVLSSGGLAISASKLKVNYGQGLASTSAAELYAVGYAPTGAIMMWSTSAAPATWYLCNGDELDGSGGNSYANLFGVLGTQYGGSSISAFNVPNFMGKVGVGLSAAGADYCSAMGRTSGVKEVSLTEAQLAEHTHTAYGANSVGSSRYFDGTTALKGGEFAANAIGNTGTGAAHYNLQPFITVTYIIKL